MSGVDIEPRRQLDCILVTIANKLKRADWTGGRKIFNSQIHGRCTFVFHLFQFLYRTCLFYNSPRREMWHRAARRCSNNSSAKDPDLYFLNSLLDVWTESCASNGCTTRAAAVCGNRQNIRLCAQRIWPIPNLRHLFRIDGVGPTSKSPK